MTQHVREGYRNHRKATWAALLVVLTTAVLAVVLPAIGATTNIPPASQPRNVLPTLVNVGGSNFSCSTNTGGVGPAGMSTFQVPNPPSSATSVTYDSTNTGSNTTLLPPGVTFKLTGLNGPDKGKFFAFKVTGARVFHVGVKGGADAAWYNYTTPFPLGVTDDGAAVSGGVPTSTTGLHSTKKDPNNFYVASYTTFCYKPVVKVEGFAYRDTNGDGSTTSDSVLANHQVTLSTGGSTTTDGTGKYSFLVPTGSSFTVCAPAAAGEVQTKPNDNDDSTNACTSADGYSFTNIASDQTGQDFAFSGGVTASCTQDGSGSAFQSQFNSPDANATDTAKFYYYGLSCKAHDQQFIFTTYASGSTRFAKLSPVSPLGDDECDLATGVGCQITAEKITWSFTGYPDLKTLSYDDTAQGGGSGVMKFCLKDPFDRSASDGVTLFTGPGYYPSDILPAGESACLARTTQYGPPGNAKRVDETYDAYDGYKGLG